MGTLYWQREPDEPNLAVEIYQPEESEEEDTVLVSVESPKESGAQQAVQLQK